MMNSNVKLLKQLPIQLQNQAIRKIS